jgi:hypothetical protein
MLCCTDFSQLRTKKQTDIQLEKRKKLSIYKLATSDAGFNFKQDTLYFFPEISQEAVFVYPNKDTAFVKLYFEWFYLEGIKQWYPEGVLAEERFYVSE